MFNTAELRDVTCRKGSCSVTCHQKQVSLPRHNPSHISWYSTYRPGMMEGWVSLGTCGVNDLPKVVTWKPSWSGFEPGTFQSQVRHPTTRPPRVVGGRKLQHRQASTPTSYSPLQALFRYDVLYHLATLQNITDDRQTDDTVCYKCDHCYGNSRLMSGSTLVLVYVSSFQPKIIQNWRKVAFFSLTRNWTFVRE